MNGVKEDIKKATDVAFKFLVSVVVMEARKRNGVPGRNEVRTKDLTGLK